MSNSLKAQKYHPNELTEKEHLDKLVAKARKKEQVSQPKRQIIDDMDELILPPKATDDMLYGLVGEIARTASTGTEINPVAAAMTFLSFIGANVGRDTFFLVGNTYHHPRIYTLHIGRSSRGGKGDSQQLTQRIRKRIEELEPDLLGKTHTGGLSSGEGLAAMIHDKYGETPPINDKRLWVVEGELANLLKKIAREGNVLSTTLREMWDGSDIKPAVKTRPMGVTEPHLGLHACITPSELSKTLNKGEIDNGFANRFLMIFSENQGCVPFPEQTPIHTINRLSSLVIEALKYALGGYPDNSNTKEMSLSKSARLFYDHAYRDFKTPLDNEQIAGLMARRAPYTLRLAMIFALLDKTRVIEEEHLKSALAWVEYATQTVRFVFQSERQTEKDTEIKRNASKILNFLEDQSGASLSDINNFCFKGHIASSKIKAALHYLITENPPLIKSYKSTTKGRTKEIFKIENNDIINNLVPDNINKQRYKSKDEYYPENPIFLDNKPVEKIKSLV